MDISFQKQCQDALGSNGKNYSLPEGRKKDDPGLGYAILTQSNYI
jgi:hypothetical protein